MFVSRSSREQLCLLGPGPPTAAAGHCQCDRFVGPLKRTILLEMSCVILELGHLPDCFVFITMYVTTVTTRFHPIACALSHSDSFVLQCTLLVTTDEEKAPWNGCVSQLFPQRWGTEHHHACSEQGNITEVVGNSWLVLSLGH